MTLIKKAKWAYIAVSAALVVLGILVIIWPKISALVLCYLFAVVLAICGIMKIVGYFRDSSIRVPFRYDFAVGCSILFAGILLAAFSEKIITGFVLAVGICLIAVAAIKFQTAIDAYRFGFVRWWALLVAACLSLVLGLFLVINPVASRDVMIKIAGVGVIYAGLQGILTVLYIVKLSKLVTTEKVVYEFD